MTAAACTVPASTANLGPGYEVLGLAVDRTLAVLASPRDDGNLVVERRDSAAQDNMLDPRHDPILRGFRTGAELQDVKLTKGFTIVVEGDIPKGRGLGTVSAGFAAGLALSCELAKKPLPEERLLQALVGLGGDPAHGVASLCTGLASATNLRTEAGEDRWRVLRHPLHADWHLVFALPDLDIGTSATRRILPPTLPHGIASRTAGRVLALVRALAEGDTEALGDAMIDDVHVPFRRRMVPGLDEAMAAAVEAGAAGVTLSGHGPGVVAFALGEDGTEDLGQAMAEAFEKNGARCETAVLRPFVR